MKTRARTVLGILTAIACSLFPVATGSAAPGSPAMSNSGVVTDRGVTSSDAAYLTHRGPLSQAGRWIIDGDGRVFLTQGVNMVYKLAPFTPQAAGFDANDAEWLRANGFDSVRLGFLWKGMEPQPGRYNEAYLDALAATVQELSSRGIAVLIDAHQDMYNEKFQGEFAPDWAVKDDGFINQPQAGFPTNQTVNPALMRAYDNFLNNAALKDGSRLQDRFAAMWAHVAARFADTPGIMGYDILNEPWPGSSYPRCYLGLGDCGAATEKLDALHQRVGSAIVAQDPDAVVYYEPYSIWNQGLNTSPTAPKVPNSVLSWHVYCSINALAGKYTGCDTFDNAVFANAHTVSQNQGSGSLLSEFGATNDADTLWGVTSKARENLVGWQYWAYCACNDPTTQNRAEQGIVNDPTVPGPVPSQGVNLAKLRILGVPHLRAVAGTPTVTQWNQQTGTYRAEWTSTRASGGTFPAGSVTELAVPAVNFPKGYTVSVTGGTVISAPNALRLLVASTGTGPVSVSVRPLS